MDFGTLKKQFDEAVRPCLDRAGFRRIAAGIWNRRKGDDLNVIQLQRHSAKSEFCVNLGIHYSFLPKAGFEAPVDIDKIKILDCELNHRLTERDALKDQWWPVAASSIQPVADLICHRALPIFDAYRLDGSIRAMDAKSVASGNLGLLDSLGPVGACLLLARMHEHLGNRAECVECARLGLELAGRMEVGPKASLTDLLKRVESRPERQS